VRARRGIAAGALVLAAACSSGDGDAGREATTTSTTAGDLPATTQAPPTVPGAALPRAWPAPPELYEVVYRVERVATGVVDTEQRLVRSPFEVRIETHRGEPDEVDLDAAPAVLDLNVLGGSETGGVEQDRLLVVVPPAPALRAAHVRIDVAAAEEAGLVEPLDVGRRIAGRSCAELRTGAPLDGGILREPTDDDHVDVCVSDDGLVLREEVTSGGDVIERRTAVSVDTAAQPEDDAFSPLGYRIPEADGGGRVRLVTPDSRPPGVRHLQLAAPPDGMALLGRYGVLTDTVPGANAAGTPEAVISMVDVYAGGGEVLAIENGAGVLGGRVLGRGDIDTPLPYAPEATAVLLTTGVELRAPFEDGRFLRLTTTLPLDRAVALASSLEILEGPGQVVPADDEPDVTGRFQRPG